MNLSKQCPDLNITVKASDLTEMARFCVLEAKREIQQDLTDAATEKYLTPKATADVFGVDASTLWRWNKRNYLNHVSVGGLRRYRKSDIDKILEGK